MFVREFMTAKVAKVSSKDSLEAALEKMKRIRVRRLPVVDKGRLVGIVTLSDIHRATGVAGYKSRRKAKRANQVRGAMSRGLATVAPDETLERAALLMLDRRISGLPVCKGKKLVGIITESDIFRAMIKVLGFESRGARVVLDLKTNEDIIPELVRLTRGLSVQSLVSYHNLPKRNWRVVARLTGRKRR